MAKNGSTVLLPVCPDPFFDRSISWDTDNPSLTRCMTDTALSALPVLLMAATHLIDRAFNGKSSLFTGSDRPREVPRRRSRLLFASKVSLTCVLMSNSACELAFRAATLDRLHGSDIFGPLCLLVSYCAALAVSVRDRRRARHTSAPLFVFWWSLLLLTAAPVFKSQLEGLVGTFGSPFWWERLALAATFFPVVLVLAVLNCWPDLRHSPAPLDPPEQSASVPSIISFSWLSKLLTDGYRGTLRAEELPEVPAQLATEAEAQKVFRLWQRKKGMKLWKLLFSAYKRDLLGIWSVGLLHYTS